MIGGVAVADSKIGSNRIKDDAVRSRHINDGSVFQKDLGAGVVEKLNEPGVSNFESDGPYPGRPDTQNNLQNLPGNQGAQSVTAWTGDNGVAMQQSWVMCPAGKAALGGGYGDNDGGGQNGLNIVTSAPVQVRPTTGGGFEFFYQPIADDAAGSFVPNAWLVEGFNHNPGGELIVRPHVICAELAG
jgi:hypothetical protein